MNKRHFSENVVNAQPWKHGLSLKAVGLLCILLDLVDSGDCDLSLASLVRLAQENGMGDGRDSIRNAISELERKGFLARQREREANGTLVGTEWWISDTPVFSK